MCAVDAGVARAVGLLLVHRLAEFDLVRLLVQSHGHRQRLRRGVEAVLGEVDLPAERRELLGLHLELAQQLVERRQVQRERRPLDLPRVLLPRQLQLALGRGQFDAGSKGGVDAQEFPVDQFEHRQVCRLERRLGENEDRRLALQLG